MFTLLPHSSLTDDLLQITEKAGSHGEKCDKSTAQFLTCSLGETKGKQKN